MLGTAGAELVDQTSVHQPARWPEWTYVKTSWWTPDHCLSFSPSSNSYQSVFSPILSCLGCCKCVLSGLFLPWYSGTSFLQRSQKDVFRSDPLLQRPAHLREEIQLHGPGRRALRGLAPAHLSSLGSVSWLGQAELFPALGSLHLASLCLEQSSCSFVFARLFIASLESHPWPPCGKPVSLSLFSVPSPHCGTNNYYVLLLVLACWLTC